MPTFHRTVPLNQSFLFDTVFSPELDTMLPVLCEDWKDGFERLWEMFLSLYPQAFRIKLSNFSNKQHIALFSIFTFFQARELCFVPEIFQSVDI